MSDRIIRIIESLNGTLGRIVSWCTLVLVLVIVVDVFLRYVFSVTSAASFELEWHLFSLIFLLGAGWTLQEDRHVRVDLFYQHYSPKRKAIVNLVGTLFLLFPFCVVAITESIPFVLKLIRCERNKP